MTNSCEFVHQGKPVDPKQYIGEPAAPREPLLMSKCLESLLESRLDFVLHQEAMDMGLLEDAAMQAAKGRQGMDLNLQLPHEEAAMHMIDAAELDDRSVPMNWVMDQEFENIELAQRNLLPRIARFVQRRLLLSTRYCLMGSCYTPIPPTLHGLKPIVCESSNC